MRLFQNSQKNPHKATYQLVRECLRKTNKSHREQFADRLEQKQGRLARLRYFLFLNPASIILVTIIIFLIFLFIAFYIGLFVNNNFIRLAFLFSYIICSLAMPFFLEKLTPKTEVGWDDRWKKVLEQYLKETKLQNNKNQAKQNLKRAILYYRREGEPVHFIVKTVWGGIFIGCLPTPSFQKALMTFSAPLIWEANPLGLICLCVMPFIYPYYYVNYEVSIAWLENVLVQIELEE